MKIITVKLTPAGIAKTINLEGDIIHDKLFEFIDDNQIEISDGYHTMHELYEHRMALNIVLFNIFAAQWRTINNVGGPIDLHWCPPQVMKSKQHHDGTMFDGYFIVMAITSEGQISYHYKLKHWDKFKIPEVERTPEWDGHGSLQVIERLMKL